MLRMEELGPGRTDEAVALFAQVYRTARRSVPLLPERHEEPQEIHRQLKQLLERSPGVAALEGDRLVGFISAFVLNSFGGTQRGVYTPEWAHAATGENRGRLYQHMYEHISSRWVENGCFTHAITHFAGDREAVDAWFQGGFGMLVIDALRPVEPVALNPSGPSGESLVVRRAVRDDLDTVMPLVHEHQRYLASAPIFLPFFSADGPEDFDACFAESEVVGNSQEALWLAFIGDELVAYMRSGPSNPRATFIVSDAHTVSITGAYTKEHLRRNGIAAALLQSVVDWARSRGAHRIAVDFESANIYGSRFWLRHFTPACYSMVRHVDPRIAWARHDRRLECMR